MAKPFTLYVLQSAHTDIGYTHPQEQIARMYVDFYDRLLDLCRRSESAPEPQRFKWVCETAWQVRNYVTARPEREDEFLHFVRAGQIEIVASYLHFSDLIDADAYERSLQWALEYGQKHRVPVRCLFHCDINGWPWAVADLAAKHGLPYFCSQVHIDSATDPLGRRGSVHYHWRLTLPEVSPQAPIRVPQAFWWRGPHGGRVLHWLGEHYCLGNLLGLSGNHQFGTDKTRYYYEADVTTVEELLTIATREVPAYVSLLREHGYPHDAVLVGTGGIFADNAPPDGRWCDVIARWNQEHTDIRLRTTTLTEWFEYLVKQESAEWPTQSVAWPDHWAHGLGSATARVAQARRTQRRRSAVSAAVAESGSAVAAEYLDAGLEQERLGLEHTFSAWSTTQRPAWALNDFQQTAKDLTFHRAELLLDAAATAALRACAVGGPARARLHVLQPGATGPACVHFDGGDWGPRADTQALRGLDGETHRFQLDRGQPDEFVAVLPLRAGQIETFYLVDLASAPGQTGPTDLQLRTEAWSLTVDAASGGLASLRETASGREWVQTDTAYGFGQLVHQSVIHPLGREAVGNLHNWITLGIASTSLRDRWVETPVCELTALRPSGETQRSSGPVFDAITLSGAAGPLGQARVTWRAYHALPLIELVLDWEKPWHDRPEAAYVAFPFAGAADLALETAGGFFRPGDFGPGGQLPGTCSTYYTVQRGARVQSSDGGLLYWLPLDAPLVMTNSLDFNRWERDPWSWNGFLASMPVNHYWHTNFAISQRGLLRLRYRFIVPPAAHSADDVLQTALPLDALGWR